MSSSILLADEPGGLERVRAGALVDREGDRGLAVERAGLVVRLRAELDPGDVAEPDDPAVGVGLEDHVGELLGVGEPAEGAHRVLEDLAVGDRRLADLAGGDLGRSAARSRVVTSLAVRLRNDIFSGSSQTRML